MKYALVALAMLAGCASPPYWVKTHEPLRALPPILVSASPWPGVQGWITRSPKTGTCQPFIVASADYHCVLAHELKHCAGYDHPRYQRSLACHFFRLP